MGAQPRLGPFEMSSDHDSRDHVASVVKAMRLFDCFTQENPEPTLADFVRETGLTKATAHRLLASLERAGWVLRTPSRGYRLSLKPFELGSLALERLDIRQEALPFMEELAQRFGETVYLLIPDHMRAVCVEHVESRGPVRLQGNVGRSRTFNLGAGPLAMLAFTDGLLEAALEDGLDRLTERSLVEPGELRDELARIRERGYSIAIDDITAGIGAVGAPVFDRSGSVVAAISMAGLASGFEPPRRDELAHAIVEAAEGLSARLGHRPPAAAATAEVR
jgi:IclR family transcriptional regulator, KDG regulon repressor